MSAETDEQIDIRGAVCPYTFVKSKLKIETMDIGQTLCVITNHEPATLNVPRSMENEGHEIIEQPRKINETDWAFVIRKNG